MKIIRFKYNDITLVGGFQFWSNPAIADTEKAIAIVLCRPTLIDLIMLSLKYGSERMKKENNDLLAIGLISQKTHARNKRRLTSISDGINVKFEKNSTENSNSF